MSAAELLLRRLVEQAGGGAETGYVLVIDGEGLEDLPPQVPTPQATYGVPRARTELGLRQLLRQARGAPIIVVLPEELARRIRQAPDLLRPARNQRVHSLQVTDVLEVALGVRVVGAEPPWLQQLALDHVGSVRRRISSVSRSTVVDRRLLTELLIDACGASRCGPARRRSCSPAGCASRPAGATTCGVWCKKRCRRSTATRGGCSRGPSASQRRGCAMRSLGWLSPAAPESCILRPQNLADTAALGGIEPFKGPADNALT